MPPRGEVGEDGAGDYGPVDYHAQPFKGRNEFDGGRGEGGGTPGGVGDAEALVEAPWCQGRGGGSPESGRGEDELGLVGEEVGPEGEGDGV